MNRNEIIKEVSDFVIEKLFRGKAPADFTNDTPLISSRLLDSIVVLGLISHIEEKLNIELEAHEVSVDNLDSINITADFILQKLKK